MNLNHISRIDSTIDTLSQSTQKINLKFQRNMLNTYNNSNMKNKKSFSIKVSSILPNQYTTETKERLINTIEHFTDDDNMLTITSNISEEYIQNDILDIIHYPKNDLNKITINTSEPFEDDDEDEYYEDEYE